MITFKLIESIMPMDRKDAAKIQAHMDSIILSMDVTDFQNKLVGNGLTLDTINKLSECTAISEKNKRCLEYLIKDGSNGTYGVLITLLKDRGYHEVVEKLESGLPPATPSGKGAGNTRTIQVPEHKRHIKLSTREKDLVHLADVVSPKGKLDWAPCLGVEQLDVEHIEMEYIHGRTQMMHILFKWARRPGRDATLGELMDRYNDALGEGVAMDIEKLEEIIKNL
ncbi:uncharacterized protein [Argopecten irradians]|uniref:uncharacterized protein n=1 Tax=Argopecten irradians TaxID=31199 RepID=UPI00371A2456